MRRIVAAAILACAVAGCTAPATAPEAVGVAPAVTPSATDGTTGPTARPTPPPAIRVSRAALLTPGDFGSGYTVAEPAEEAAPPVEPAYLLPVMDCPQWQPGPGGPSGAAVLAGARQLYAAPRGHYDGLAVWRFRPGAAAQAMREVADQVRLCPTFESVGDEDVRISRTWTVLARDFAGPGALVLRTELARNGTVSDVDFFVIVQRDDAVAALWLSDQRWTTDRLRAVGQRMASRLADIEKTG